ncbi:MAG: prepilin-type N-terminal cleavage/methylation domain-containing protein [Armatimonadota bacterium]
MQRARRGFSLVEILVVIVVIAVLAAVLYPMYVKGGKTPDGKQTQSPIQAAHSVECMNNLSQIRQAHQMATATGDLENPVTGLESLKSYGISDSMTACPVSKAAYQYDPATGQVRCPTHSGAEAPR